MSKFCENCGAALAASGKFCGSCGFATPPEIQHCPTCGQEWEGIKVEAVVPATPKAAATPKPREVITPAAVVVNIPAATPVIAHNTTANVQPVYGSLYVEGKDCPNCGTANMANKTCKTCESEN